MLSTGWHVLQMLGCAYYCRVNANQKCLDSYKLILSVLPCSPDLDPTIKASDTLRKEQPSALHARYLKPFNRLVHVLIIWQERLQNALVAVNLNGNFAVRSITTNTTGTYSSTAWLRIKLWFAFVCNLEGHKTSHSSLSEKLCFHTARQCQPLRYNKRNPFNLFIISEFANISTASLSPLTIYPASSYHDDHGTGEKKDRYISCWGTK